MMLLKLDLYRFNRRTLTDILSISTSAKIMPPDTSSMMTRQLTIINGQMAVTTDTNNYSRLLLQVL
jgi:hypothetical protein